MRAQAVCFQVTQLLENGKDVTELVDQGLFFHTRDELAKHLSEVTGDNIQF